MRRTILMECTACGYADLTGHACPEMNGLTSANGVEYVSLPDLKAALRRVDERLARIEAQAKHRIDHDRTQGEANCPRCIVLSEARAARNRLQAAGLDLSEPTTEEPNDGSE